MAMYICRYHQSEGHYLDPITRRYTAAVLWDHIAKWWILIFSIYHFVLFLIIKKHMQSNVVSFFGTTLCYFYHWCGFYKSGMAPFGMKMANLRVICYLFIKLQFVKKINGHHHVPLVYLKSTRNFTKNDVSQ